LDRLAAVSAFGQQATLEHFAADIASSSAELNDRAGEWIAAAPGACRALRPTILLLKADTSRQVRLLLSGLARCLRPNDPELGLLIVMIADGIAAPSAG
jgi:hypothetical protein